MEKLLFDEIHGFIRLGGVVRDVVDTPVFQRLRRIRQLSAAYLVYPGATHTRFSHSLGTMHLMDRAVGALYSKGLMEEDGDLLRLAALLHDIGHLPMSHTLEQYYRRRGLRLGHEELGAIVIEGDPELRGVLEQYGYSAPEIASLVGGNHPSTLYVSLLSGDVDVDRMDYLLRDARHTGVVYGVIDAERILTMMLVDDEKGRIGFEYKALQALENFYLARLHMYQAVYYHKTITGYELLISEFYSRLLEDLGLQELSTMKGLEDMIRKGRYAYWDDCWLLDHARRAVLGEEEVSGEARRLAASLLNRRGLELVADMSRPLWRRDEGREVVEEIRDIAGELEAEGGLVLWDADLIPVIRREEAPRIRMPDGSWENLENVSSVVAGMPRYYLVARVYRVGG